jgi:hypothetical protein
MSLTRKGILVIVAGCLLLLAGIRLGRALTQQGETEPPIAYAWGSQVSIYYPAQKKIFVYSELGGNCVYAYTLSTPGGPIARENCK